MKKSFLNVDNLVDKLPNKEYVFPISMCTIIDRMSKSDTSDMEIKVIPRIEL